MTVNNRAINNIFASDTSSKRTGELIEIDGLNAIVLEPNGNKLPVILLNSSFSLGQTVICANQIVQRVINKQKTIPIVKI